MVVSDEGQTSISVNVGILGSSPAIESQGIDIAMYAKGGPSRFKKNYGV